MSGRLEGRKVVVLLAEGFEDLEFWVTVMRLREEGAAVTIAGLSTDPVRGKNGLEAKADVPVADVASAGTRRRRRSRWMGARQAPPLRGRDRTGALRA